MESSSRGRLTAAGLIIIALAGATLGLWMLFRPAGGTGTVPERARNVPGQGERVVVEVLNASGAVALARDATRRLRDAGLDVVYFGNDTARALDSTEVLLRRGADDRAERVRRALGAGSVRAAPDTTRLVDVTVRLGRDFAGLVRNP